MQQNIFGKVANPIEDLLDYIPGFFNKNESLYFMDQLTNNIAWKQETLKLFGRSVNTPRLTAWYGDAGITYSYSGRQFSALPWTKDLLEIKAKVELATDAKFNSVLLNYYRDGNDSMGWHSDDEPELGVNPIIASINFGQERRFDFRYKAAHQQKDHILLTDGSLLLMKGDIQHHWQHQIAKSKKQMGRRINLTFRYIY